LVKKEDAKEFTTSGGTRKKYKDQDEALKIL
jgi:hypothetical protein